ncbi:class I adenylate-forming enzyme family protein [Anaerosacchariphilus polymeriproducens]|uniref:class I adenylate-forming enzyme family protein n=1 Tax=Anaerosacchariphilus polymeriproducens TaxID=1812858 RepID=UPI0013903A28|nr:class I adenylate-forming enzyme family protein [Anaerosacchariphilus polymeriproducens]
MYNIYKEGMIINPDGVAIDCNEENYSYREFDMKIQRLAYKIREEGIMQNSKILMVVDHPLIFVTTFFALSYLGTVIMPIYTKTGLNKMEDIIDTYDINYIVKESKLEKLKFNKKYQYINDIEELTLYKCSECIDATLESVKLILFTSGTTNIPKSIMLSNDNILSNVKAISAYLKLNSTDNILLIKDLSHSSSIIGELLVGIFNGCKIVLNYSLPRINSILKLISTKKISIFFAVPTLLKGIVEYSKLKKYDMSSLRIINFYGASMHSKDIMKVIEKFPKVNLIYSYGQTEASPRVTYIEKKDLLTHSSSSGKAIEKVIVEVLNESGDVAAPMEIGEITIIGPNVMLGYYRNEDKTRKTIKNNRLYSGDLGYMDDEGFLYVIGRKDNMIISAGKNIYPEEIEGVLTSYKDIKEVLVVDKKNDNATSELIAYVVLNENVHLNNEAIYVYSRIHLENYKIPKEIIVVKQLEKTASGKIKRINKIKE